MSFEGSFSDEIMMDPEDPMSDVLYSHDYNMNWLKNLTDDLAMDDISAILSMVGNGSSLNQTLADIDNLFTLSNDLFFRVSQDNSNMFEFITEGVLLTAVSIFGLVGNIIAIVVLSRPSMKGSFSTLLIGKQPQPNHGIVSYQDNSMFSPLGNPQDVKKVLKQVQVFDLGIPRDFVKVQIRISTTMCETNDKLPKLAS